MWIITGDAQIIDIRFKSTLSRVRELLIDTIGTNGDMAIAFP
jgi:hypothetical protein